MGGGQRRVVGSSKVGSGETSGVLQRRCSRQSAEACVIRRDPVCTPPWLVLEALERWRLTATGLSSSCLWRCGTDRQIITSRRVASCELRVAGCGRRAAGQAGSSRRPLRQLSWPAAINAAGDLAESDETREQVIISWHAREEQAKCYCGLCIFRGRASAGMRGSSPAAKPSQIGRGEDGPLHAGTQRPASPIGAATEAARIAALPATARPFRPQHRL